MRKLIFSAVTVIALLSCKTTGGRRVASEEDESRWPSCSKAFQLELARQGGDDPELGELSSSNARVFIHYVSEAFPKEFKARLSEAQTKQGCQKWRPLAALEKELQVKIKGWDDNIKNLELAADMVDTFVTDPAFSDPNLAEKMGCLMPCMLDAEDGDRQDDEGAEPETQEEHEEYYGSRKCSSRCNLNLKEITKVLRMVNLHSVARACAERNEDDRIVAFHTEEFVANLKPFLVSVRKPLLAMAPHVRQGVALKDPVHKRFTEMKDEVAALLKAKPKQLKCPEPALPAWTKTLPRSVVHLSMNEGGARGSGFFVEGPHGESRFVTVNHNYSNREDRMEWHKKKLTVSTAAELAAENKYWRANDPKAKRPAQRKMEIEPEPGKFNRGMDLFFKNEKWNGPLLKVVDAGTLPKPGQKFFISGFPQIKGITLTTYPCTFLGFGRAQTPTGRDVAYAFKCPAMEGNVGGMSGGPILDENGRVWSALSHQTELAAMVFGSPVFRGRDGELQLGFREPFLSDDCLDETMSGRRRCQIMPNMFDKFGP